VIGALVKLSESDPANRQTFEAMSLAIDAINLRGGAELPAGQRRQLRLAAYDDADSVDRVGPDLRRLAEEDQAVAVIGPAERDTATLARCLAEQLSVPLVTLAATPTTRTDAWRWSFALAPDDEAPVATLIDYLAASGVERIGWLAPRTTTASDAQGALSRRALAAGLGIAASEVYPLGDGTMAARHDRLKAAGAQVIVAWPHDTRGTVSLQAQLRSVPDRLPVFLGPAAADPKTLALDGGTIDGLHTVTPRLGVVDDLWDHDAMTPLIRDFVRAFRQRFGVAPDDSGAAAWDAVHLIERALSQAGPSRDGVRVALEQTTDLTGVSGIVAFGASQHTGLDRRAFVVARSADGRWRLPP
jgi:branched-chain amino acid transport system substrate-binding protein